MAWAELEAEPAHIRANAESEHADSAVDDSVDVYPVTDSGGDFVHAHRDRSRNPASGYRHATDTAKPGIDRSGAVPVPVHHGAGNQPGL